MYNRTEFIAIHSYRVADTVIGIIYILCFVFGVPANLLSLVYFTRQRLKTMDLPTCLYALTALQDTIITFLSLKHGITLLREREDVFKDFCPVHHILFQMSQRMSVFLIATLSVTRTYTLVYPLKRVRKKTVLKVLALLWFLMTCFFVVPASAGIVHISYHYADGYCWAEPIAGNNLSHTWDRVDNIMDTVGLACPIVPIIVSCVVSAVKIQSSIPVRGSCRRSNCSFSSAIKNSNRKATITIIIVTILYIISNIPLFINFTLWVITTVYYSYPGPFYGNVVMYYYSWNVTALLSTALNATANPIVYLTRFERFRRWLITGCKLDDPSWKQNASTLPISQRVSVASAGRLSISIDTDHRRRSCWSEGEWRPNRRLGIQSSNTASIAPDCIVMPNMNISLQELPISEDMVH